MVVAQSEQLSNKTHPDKMLAKDSSSFFNLPVTLEANGSREVRILGMRQDHTLHTHWRSLEDHSLSKSSLLDAFANNIPLVREGGFLSEEECNAILDILQTHKIVRLHIVE